MPGNYRRNIYSLYLIKISKWLMLIMPIVALFYNENGLDEMGIYLFQAIYSVSVVVLEILSGYMADIVGRKKTLLLGSILGTLGFVIYSITSSFLGFLIAEVTLGIGGSFISGADSAMLFNNLAAMCRKHRYLQFEGRITPLGSFAETGAAICGGTLAAMLSYQAIYVSQAVIAAVPFLRPCCCLSHQGRCNSNTEVCTIFYQSARIPCLSTKDSAAPSCCHQQLALPRSAWHGRYKFILSPITLLK